MAASSAEEIADAIRDAIASEHSLEIMGAGSKRALGRPVNATSVLDVSACAGILTYEPEELVLTARAGTPLAEIEALLAANNQMLAFEPPDYGALLGAKSTGTTLGGTIAVNASGPRRFKAGAARDHVLGVTAVSGRGEIFKAGGKVVKNVTGYDIPRLLAGSFGTLAVMTEITLKVLPRPETERSLALRNLDDEIAIRALTAALQSPWDISGAAHIPAEQMTIMRVEGIAASVDDRFEQLSKLLSVFAPIESIEHAQSQMLWTGMRNVSLFAGEANGIVWRLSLPPAQSAGAARKLHELIPQSRAIYDWGGGLVWLLMSGPDPLSEIVRAVAARAGGHATLFRAPAALRASAQVMPPLEPSLMALNRRLKQQFDPKRVLNPGRMYAEI
ncbi:MAG: glycolate oxidase subunit GlcE [Alphaproteobacteria bacterium]